MVVLNKIDAARSVLTSNPELSRKRAFSAFQIAQKLKNPKLEAFALNTIGSAYYFKNNLDSAEWFHLEAVSLQKKTNDLLGLGRSYANLGNVYMDRFQNDKAVKHFILAEKKLTKANYTEGLAKLYNSMGSLFNKIQDYKNSIRYYQKGIELAKILNDTSLNCALSINLANVYSSIHEKKKALELYLNTYKVAKINTNDVYFVMICNNICEAYIEMKEFAKARFYCDKALKSILHNQFDNYIKISTYGNYATLLMIENKNEEAKKYIDSALLFLKELPDLNKEITLKIQLSKALHFSNSLESAFEIMNEALILKDSLYRINLNEKLSELNTAYEVDKKESEILALNETRKKQRIINFLSTGVGIITFCFMLIAIRAFVRKKKDNKLIYAQKEQVEKQKQLVEIKNKEITDSINYAKRIQEAILPSRAFLSDTLKDSFVFYLPKDIVAGDFYWVEKVKNQIFIAAADCTGHGVPGALVSVICSSALSKALLEENILDTGNLLDRTRELVIEKFSKSEENVQDGMDISLCKIDGNKVQWSGANNPLWIVKDQELVEIKANKQPIGKIDNPEAYTSNVLNVESGSMIYLFTDGFADQFGGKSGKKFKYKSLKELLIRISDLDIDFQKEQLKICFEDWKGTLDQVDDVCIIGVRI